MFMFMLYIPYTWYETVICTCKCEVFGLTRPFTKLGRCSAGVCFNFSCLYRYVLNLGIILYLRLLYDLEIH